MSNADKLMDWLEAHDIASAPKQLMIYCGLNVFGFDLAMESFNRLRPEVAETMPEVFAYEHENGVLVFIRRPDASSGEKDE